MHIRAFLTRGVLPCLLLAGAGVAAAQEESKPEAAKKDEGGPPRQAPEPAVPGSRLTLAPGPQYRASGTREFFLGRHYRRTWVTPVDMEVLDLARFAGGLKVQKRGGGKQTLSLTFQAADGRLFKFRSVDKDPKKALPAELRHSAAAPIAQDQTSSAYPGAPLVVDGLCAAASLPYVEHRLVVMPDDPALGEHRQAFAGMVGMIEQVPDEDAPLPPGFEGVTKVVDSDDLYERIEDDPGQRVAVADFLRARLFDMVLGDWDRHENQWQWIRRGDDDQWHPLATDRDQAFAHFDGLLLGFAKQVHPTFQKFTSRIGVVGLATNSVAIDRRLLGALELPAYLQAARDLQKDLTNEAIVEAVRRLPGPWFRLDGERLITTLKARRDQLPQAAEAFYHLLAHDVNLHGTNGDDTVEVTADEAGGLQVVVSNQGGGEPLLRRRFKRGETVDVRFYLKGGNDRVVTHGTGDVPIKLRVDGGPGDDVLDDTQGGHAQLYDFEGHNTVVKGPGSGQNDNYWMQPVDARGYPVRDWGSSSSISPWVSAGADLGLFGGLSWRHTDYGYRKLPYSSTQNIRVGYSTARAGFKGEYIGDFVETSSERRARLRARVSDVELSRFYGFGNETSNAVQAEDYYKADQREYLFAPSYRLGAKAIGIWLGAVAKFEDTRPNPGRFLETAQPYGIEDFGEVGPQVGLVYDSRDALTASRRGLLLAATGTYYPQVWNVEQAFGVAQGQMATYLTPPGPFTLALRAGGRKIWGDRYPFFEAAFIGGPETVRGQHRNRYAGDASAFGGAELRLRLATVNLVVPVKVGLFGFGDIGRVWLADETSDVWHTGIGGGLSLAFVRPENTVTVGVGWPGALEDGRLTFLSGPNNQPQLYLTAGFTF